MLIFQLYLASILTIIFLIYVNNFLYATKKEGFGVQNASLVRRSEEVCVTFVRFEETSCE
jgi:hypothetical protein